MNTNRIEYLKKFLAESPDDPFVLYALATEYRTEMPAKAWEYYEVLLKEHENYAPTYFHAASLAHEFEKVELAKKIYEKGIEVCKAQNERHHLREIQSAYQNFLFEEEWFWVLFYERI